MARALIVGCGCRGSALGARLLADGWHVRGTSRRPEGRDSIQREGFQAVLADPSDPGTILDAAGDVTIVCWLLAPVSGTVNGEALEAVLEELSDSAVRGFVYEAGDDAGGEEIVKIAGDRWRIPVGTVDYDPVDHEMWVRTAHGVVRDLIRR